MDNNVNNNQIQMIKDYILREKLGTGSYGVVYKVMNKSKIRIAYHYRQYSIHY